MATQNEQEVRNGRREGSNVRLFVCRYEITLNYRKWLSFSVREKKEERGTHTHTHTREKRLDRNLRGKRSTKKVNALSLSYTRTFILIPLSSSLSTKFLFVLFSIVFFSFFSLPFLWTLFLLSLSFYLVSLYFTSLKSLTYNCTSFSFCLYLLFSQ